MPAELFNYFEQRSAGTPYILALCLCHHDELPTRWTANYRILKQKLCLDTLQEYIGPICKINLCLGSCNNR